MKKLFYTLLILIAFCVNGYSQDPVFSQFYSANTFLNPGLIADKSGINATVNSRFYTNSEISNYNLNQITLVLPFELKNFIYGPGTKIDHRSGVGLSVYREGTGDNKQLNTVGILLTLAHCIQLQKEHYLSLGLQGGYINKKRGDDFMWGSQYDEELGYNEELTPSFGELADLTSQFPTINAGLVYFYNSSEMLDYFKKLNFDAFLGVSLYNINTPNQSFFESRESELPMQLKVHGGLKYFTNKYFYIFPNALWVRQNGNNQVNFGAYTSIQTMKSRKDDDNNFNIILGVWYRVGDSFIASVGSQISQFKFSVSYDFNASSFQYNNRGEGSIEISLKYTVKKSQKQSIDRGLIYPSF